MDTSRIDGVKAPQHRGTLRSHRRLEQRTIDEVHGDPGVGRLLLARDDAGLLFVGEVEGARRVVLE